MISKTPVRIAQNAIKYINTTALICGHANVRIPTMIPASPSMSNAQWCDIKRKNAITFNTPSTKA
jgi:hypothetical protein